MTIAATNLQDLRTAIMDAAKQVYGDDLFDSDDQVLFSVLCDVTRIQALDDPTTGDERRDCANILDAVCENVCEDYTVTSR